MRAPKKASLDPGTISIWIAKLSAIDEEDIDELESLTGQMSAALEDAVGACGGPAIRAKLYAPTFAGLERKGLIKWTGRRAANGQKIYRLTTKGKQTCRILAHGQALLSA